MKKYIYWSGFFTALLILNIYEAITGFHIGYVLAATACVIMITICYLEIRTYEEKSKFELLKDALEQVMKGNRDDGKQIK